MLEKRVLTGSLLAVAATAFFGIAAETAATAADSRRIALSPGGASLAGSQTAIRPGGRRPVASTGEGSVGGRIAPWRPGGGSSDRLLGPDNVASLELLWEFPTPAGVTAGPVVTDDFVYVSSWDSNLHALDPLTGEEKWTYDADGFIVGSPTLVEGGDLVFGDWLSNIYRLNATTGALVWKTSVGDTAHDSIWSSVAVAGGRVFAGIASHTDVPCTKGRTAAVDLETGEFLWARVNVPDRICDTDTSIECDGDADCGGGTCIEAIGAGVTATPAPDPTGEFVYVNSVGCYTFPSVGDSDSMMKLDAATGETIWLNRVDEPEQFGFCPDGSAPECSTDMMCIDAGAGDMCQEKAAYHDFGFLNGPLLVDVPALNGGTSMLVVSGSKNGTLYAFDPDDGHIVWTNEIVPKPVSPAFGAWGLFNGALGYDGEKIYAALHGPQPDPQPDRENLQAFDARDGSTVWTSPLPRVWAHVGVGQGLVATGNNDDAAFFVHDTQSGQRLASFELPRTTVSPAAIVGDRLYIGYGISTTAGGVRAYRLP